MDLSHVIKREKMAVKTKPTPEQNLMSKIPGAELSARPDAWWWLVASTVALMAVLVLVYPDPYMRIFRFVITGLRVTFFITLTSFFLMLILGLIAGLGRLSKNKLVFGFASLYVEIVRGIPLLVQLLWWYFAFPVIIQNIGRSFGIQPLATYQANAFAMAIFGLVFCYGAYMSEIYRAGILSIPKGQMEAARSLGMNYFQAMRYVILPQAVKVILPPMGNEFIALLKDSSLISVVGVAELTRRGREFTASTFMPIETYVMVALIYLVLTLFSARIVTWIERRTGFER
jgi:polar amino acid transport system permease protein